jgi:hypothetical protein
MKGQPIMKQTLFLYFLFAGALLAAEGQQTFTGVITDSMCGKDHAMMRVTPDTRCVQECVKQGSKYALFDGKATYVLSDQKMPEPFAGKKVKVTGTLYERTKILKVDSIMADGQAAPGTAHSGHQH